MKYLIVILVIFFSLMGCVDQKKANNDGKGKEDQTSKHINTRDMTSNIDYSLDSLEINGLNIFKVNFQEIIETFNLKKIKDEEGTIYYVNKGIEFQIYDNEILYFNIKSNEFKMTNPNIEIGVSGKKLKSRYPKAYSRLSGDEIGDLQLQSFEMYDIGDNRLRIYILDNKVHNISYIIDETL